MSPGPVPAPVQCALYLLANAGCPPPRSLLCTLPTFSDKPAARPALPFLGDFMRSCATQKSPAPSEAP